MAAADRKRWAASSVKVRSLSKAYSEKTVLSDLSFSLEAGQIYCLMGTSGIGKTTLLRILMGLETPDKGSAVPEIRPESAISAVFQSPDGFSHPAGCSASSNGVLQSLFSFFPASRRLLAAAPLRLFWADGRCSAIVGRANKST